MPFASRAQSRLFHAAANNPSVAERSGISKATAEKYIADSHGQKLDRLPDRVPRHKRDGGSVYPAKFRW